ncbi:MAG: MBL fold metallo-hydrolase [Thermodesulfobacteriota bacterium]
MPDPEAKVHVTFWGTRGSISTPGRSTEKYGGNTPCVSVRCGETTVILDAGTGIRNLGIDLMEEFEGLGRGLPLHLFLSHTHWDHIQGLPFFQPSYIRDAKLTIYGSPNKERFLASILKGQMDFEYFPVSMSAFAADITIQEISEEVIHLGPIVVDWQEQICHPGGSVRYRLTQQNKRIVYATDVELDYLFGLGETTRDKKDLGDAYREFVRGADLLIADGQYSGPEYPSKVGWGHSSIPVLLEVASQCGVKQLAVFHHDPQHSDKFLDDLWAKSRFKYGSEEHRTEVFWAREGLTLAI